MSGGGLGSTGVTQSGGGSSFGMNQPSQGMGQFSPGPMQQPTQGPFGGLGNMQVSPYNSTSQQNIFGGQQGMGQGFQQPNSNLLQQDATQAGNQFLDFYNQQVAGLIPGPKASNRTVDFPSMQPMQQGPFGGQFGNMFGGQQFGFQQPQQFGFQQPQPFYQQQFNPYAMASQAQRLGISQVPIRNQYGPYGGQMYQRPGEGQLRTYQQPMQQPMQQPQTNYPQPMGYPQPMQDPTATRTLGDAQEQFMRQQLAMRGIPDNFGLYQSNQGAQQSAIRQQRTVQSQRAGRLDPTAVSYSPQAYREMQQQMPQQSAINFQQQITDPQTGRTFDLNSPVAQDLATSSAHARAMAAFNKTNSSQQQFNPNQVMHHGMVATPMPRHMLPQEMQGQNVSDTIVDTGRVDMTSPAESPMTAQDILKMAVGKSTPDLRYDSNGDGKITSADALAFQRSMQQKGMV